MRFVCESCRAQYMINDEKVGPKGVKVRCRKCGYVILVKRADAQAAKMPPSVVTAPVGGDPDDAMATQVLNNPLANGDSIPGNLPIDDAKTSQESSKDLLSGVGEDEIGAVFDQVLSSGTHPKEALDAALDRAEAGQALGDEPDDRMSTRVLDAEVVKKLAEESTDQPANGANGHGNGKDEVPQTDWFVAIDDKQTGPLTLDNVKQHWDRGEIGPDSLCWRAGFDDWIPLSDVAALASVLAPKPQKPIVVAAPPPGAVVSVPVESAFSAGGMTKTVRSEMQVPLAAAPAEETGTWRPSAASALSSLIKDEMQALSNPAPKVADPLPPSDSMKGGLLDLPPPSESSISGNGKNGSHAQLPQSEDVRTSRPPRPANPYVATPGATYSSPAVTQYRPKDNKQLIVIIAIAAGVVVVGLFGTILWLANRQPVVVVQQQQQPQQPVVAQQPTQPKQPTPGQTAAPAQPPPAQPAPGQPTPGQTAAPAQPAAVAANSGKTEPARPAMPHGAVERRGTGRPALAAREREEPKAEPKREEAAPEPKKGGKSKEDDDFANAFGGGDDKPKAAAKPAESEDKPKKNAVWIPPAPGGGGDGVKDSLGQSDVMEVVLANKGGLAHCAEEQHKRDPSTSGKLVMRWSILTSGKTSNVSVVSDEFKGTYMATCVGGLIKSMNFPRAKKAGEPVVFPFKF